MIELRQFKSLVLTLIVSGALMACGGGGGGAISVERIQGISVPPAPDPAKNASTVAGVDSDSNGIRDDIDRKLATDFGAKAADYSIAVNHAKSLQAALVTPNDTNANKHVSVVVCADQTIRTRLRDVTTATLDTLTRRNAYATAFAGVVISYEGCMK